MGPGDSDTKGCRSSNSNTGAGTETPPPLELELELTMSTRPNNSSKNIDDLPELLLVEILCRLGYNKFIFQCKCVSKRWCELISSPHFISTFVRSQHDYQNPILSTLVVGTGTFFPVLETTSRSSGRDCPLSMNLRLPLVPDVKQLYVVGACYDLLLCCPTKVDQWDYYICNPYTKRWVALPTPHRFHNYVHIGFICDPFYNVVEGATFSSSNIIQLNNEYKWRVVRILPNFYVDIFFSEIGEWRESENVLSSRPYSDIHSPGVAYNGKLYWSGSDEYTAFTFELDPFSSTTSTLDGDIIVDKCRLTLGPIEWPNEWPVPANHLLFMCLGASRGCLRVCERTLGAMIRVWELDEGVDNLVAGAGNNLKWRLVEDTNSFNQMSTDSDHPSDINGAKIVLGFHPTNENIVYFDDYDHIVMCNFGARTLKVVPGIPSRGIWTYNHIHPFVLPRWPTPVPRL